MVVQIRTLRTYQEVTPESAEHGDFSDLGEVGDEEYSFRELVELFRSAHFSANPVKFADYNTWAIFDCGVVDFQTGADRQECLHFRGEEWQRKYWLMAIRTADRLKRERRES